MLHLEAETNSRCPVEPSVVAGLRPALYESILYVRWCRTRVANKLNVERRVKTGFVRGRIRQVEPLATES